MIGKVSSFVTRHDAPLSVPLVYGGPNIELGVRLSQLRRTCDECHKSKVKCHGTLDQACARCLKMGKECQYSMSGRAKRRRTSSLKLPEAASSAGFPLPLSPTDYDPAAGFISVSEHLTGAVSAPSCQPKILLTGNPGLAYLDPPVLTPAASIPHYGFAVPPAPQTIDFSSHFPDSASPACRCFTRCLEALEALSHAPTTSSQPFETIMHTNRSALRASADLLGCHRCTQVLGVPAAAAMLDSLLTRIGLRYVDAGIENVTAAIAAADPALATPTTETLTPSWTPAQPGETRTETMSLHLVWFAEQVELFETVFVGHGSVGGEGGGMVARVSGLVSVSGSVARLRKLVGDIARLRDWGMPDDGSRLCG
ncbi:hypothetical protein N658DRAFT_557147 [Parathielavia hyrcaniae]|uniref:Zn(2)-C6 fungal-type domain-containing protein n=1 Tax=Parathielavia hyrcaniae TaxID=113614 RepID=A0AAN6Q630_9PEZI|nr:hypothetical protein N658DRAFT_557147 [Parathielavia hyrcaniae]